MSSVQEYVPSVLALGAGLLFYFNQNPTEVATLPEGDDAITAAEKFQMTSYTNIATIAALGGVVALNMAESDALVQRRLRTVVLGLAFFLASLLNSTQAIGAAFLVGLLFLQGVVSDDPQKPGSDTETDDKASPQEVTAEAPSKMLSFSSAHAILVKMAPSILAVTFAWVAYGTLDELTEQKYEDQKAAGIVTGVVAICALFFHFYCLFVTEEITQKLRSVCDAGLMGLALWMCGQWVCYNEHHFFLYLMVAGAASLSLVRGQVQFDEDLFAFGYAVFAGLIVAMTILGRYTEDEVKLDKSGSLLQRAEALNALIGITYFYLTICGGNGRDEGDNDVGNKWVDLTRNVMGALLAIQVAGSCADSDEGSAFLDKSHETSSWVYIIIYALFFAVASFWNRSARKKATVNKATLFVSILVAVFGVAIFSDAMYLDYFSPMKADVTTNGTHVIKVEEEEDTDLKDARTLKMVFLVLCTILYPLHFVIMDRIEDRPGVFWVLNNVGVVVEGGLLGLFAAMIGHLYADEPLQTLPKLAVAGIIFTLVAIRSDTSREVGKDGFATVKPLGFWDRYRV